MEIAFRADCISRGHAADAIDISAMSDESQPLAGSGTRERLPNSALAQAQTME
jgi:hypothetical protein